MTAIITRAAAPLTKDARRALELLRHAPIVRRRRLGRDRWCWGAARIGASVIAQLVAAGRAVIDGDRVVPARKDEELPA